MNFSQIVQKLWRGEDISAFLPTLNEPERRALLEIAPLVKGKSLILQSTPEDMGWPPQPRRSATLCGS